MPNTFETSLPFKVKLFNLLFKRGALFYAEYNLRFFFYGLFKRFDVIVANDLDTLLPCYLLSKLKNAELVYDSHEYFTESAGLVGRPFPKRVWTLIEQFIFPKLKRVSTVNNSIAKFYHDKYGVHVMVIKNVPIHSSLIKSSSKKKLGIEEDKKLILLQGGYIDIDRGGKELIEAMQHVSKSVILYVVGSGQELPLMKQLAEKIKLQENVKFISKRPYQELMQYTLNADLGLSLDKPTNLNYTYSLPNKLFDYMRAGVPVLVSKLPEVEQVVSANEIGMFIDNHSPNHIANMINEALSHPDYQKWCANAKTASEKYTWQNECKQLEKLYSGLL
jgi:glycosyltransferase involved in cell wall biosynthesis